MKAYQHTFYFKKLVLDGQQEFGAKTFKCKEQETTDSKFFDIRSNYFSFGVTETSRFV